MNKTFILVLAVIVALLTGWLVLTVAMDAQNQNASDAGASTAVSTPVSGVAVPTPSSTDLQLTVVEKPETDSSKISATVTR